MNFELEKEFSKIDIVQNVENVKRQVEEIRPLPNDIEGRVMQKLRLDWNYNSNAIEGNKLDYGETIALLMHGITAKGKPMKDHLDIKGHNEAINFLLSIVKDSRPITEADIRDLHQMILVEPYKVEAQTADGHRTSKTIALGKYKTQPNHVETVTGEIHYYSTPEETQSKMGDLMEWYGTISQDTTISKLIVAAVFHHKFVEIHPFDDGNGRMSRILMNLILMQDGFLPAIIKMYDRQNYYSLLSKADVGDILPFIEYISERELSSLQLYLKAAQGGNIDEDEDVDKEIAIKLMELQGNVAAKIMKTNEVVDATFKTTLFPFVQKLAIKFKPFEENFNSSEKYIKLFYLKPHPLFDDLIEDYHTITFASAESYREILQEESYTRLEFVFEYNDYKNPFKTYSVKFEIDLVLNKFSYDLIVENTIIFSKLYDEEITNIELNLLSKIVLGKF